MMPIVTPEMLDAGRREAEDQTRPDWLARAYKAMRALEPSATPPGVRSIGAPVDLGEAVHHRFDPPLT
jgi:hypothetical protein